MLLLQWSSLSCEGGTPPRDQGRGEWSRGRPSMRLKIQVPVPTLLLLDELPPLSRGQNNKVPTLQPAVRIG